MTTENILDEKAKSYLVACLVTGIDIVEDPAILMNDLVDHLNSTERHFWAQGDEDGVIVHDKNDLPIVYVMYNGHKITFNMFDQDEFLALRTNKMLGYALLNIIALLQEKGYDFAPSILGSERKIVQHLDSGTSDTNPEDWSL